MVCEGPPESKSSAKNKPLFQPMGFCPENVLYEDDLLIFHLRHQLTVYSLESKDFLREITFPSISRVLIWRIWRDELGSFFALTNRGIFSFFPDSGKVLLDEELPIGQWSAGVHLGSKDFLIMKKAGGPFKWSPPEGPISLDNNTWVEKSLINKEYLWDGNQEVITFFSSRKEGKPRLIFLRSSGKWETHYHDPISVLSVHPKEDKVATGDKKGKIILWCPLADGSYAQSIFHWHSSFVLSLAWSHESLLSGGSEEVLIKWSFHHRNAVATVPRLGGRVQGIYLQKDLAFIALSNNSMQIFERTGLTKKGHLAGPDFECISQDFSWFQPYESLVFSNRDTSLQFINPRTRKEVLRLEIVQENNAKSLRDQRRKLGTSRLHFDISSDFKWLATAREDDNTLKLSIWRFSLEEMNPFSLKTQWTEPHSSDRVAIKFIQSKEQLVVLGTENAAKLWQIDPDHHYWVKSFTYKNYSPTAVSSSEDGSVLAIAFKHAVTLWRNDGATFGLITSFSNGSKVSSLLFGRGRNAGVLFSSTESFIFVWDVLHMKLRRKIPFKCPHLVSTPDKRIAVRDNSGVYVYDADGMQSKVYEGPVSSLLFCSSSGSIHSYYLSPNRQLGRIKWWDQETTEDKENVMPMEEEEENENCSTKRALMRLKAVQSRKGNFSKDPSLFFENVQFPVSAFAIDFLDKGVSMFKDTFIFE